MAFKVTTADGDRVVRHWGYQLQGEEEDGEPQPLNAKALTKVPHDLIVIDFSKDGSGAGAFSEKQIAAMKKRKKSNSVIVSYISIGEASDYRDHWDDSWTKWTDEDLKCGGPLTDKAPSWLGAWNENWPNSRKVRYWDPAWQKIIFNDEGTGWLDQIVAAGFDGAYLDIVDGYYHWGCEVDKSQCLAGDPTTERDAAARMVDFIVALAAHARESNPEFLIWPQNGALILDALEDEDPKRKKAYLNAITGIACEDLFFRGDEAENNKLDPDKETISILVRDFIKNGKPVLSVDYLNDEKKIPEYYKQAVAKGFLPYAAPSRGLDGMGDPYDMSEDPVG
jgi:uncharacterized protein (TIGR01370 family)